MDEMQIDRQALVEAFLGEAAEILDQLEQGIVSLGSRPDDSELLHALFRAAHTLKGSSGMAGFEAVSDLAHGLEDLLEQLRAHGLAIDTSAVNLRGRPLPYLRLREFFGVGGPPPGRENVVVIQHGQATAGVAVDALHGESQTVIKPLGPVFQGLPGISGSSILGDGKVALIVDVAALLGQALKRSETH